MDRQLPRNATLPPDVLQSAIRGLMVLREVELNEINRLVFGPKDSHPSSKLKCALVTPAHPATLRTCQKVVDHIVGSSWQGTKVLQVPEFTQDFGGCTLPVFPDICGLCVERWKCGHTDLRKKAWEMLGDAFGLKG